MWTLVYDMLFYTDISLVAMQLSISSFENFTNIQEIYCITCQDYINNFSNGNIKILVGDRVTCLQKLLEQKHNLIYLSPFTGLIDKIDLNINSIGVYYNCTVNTNVLTIPNIFSNICNIIRQEFSEFEKMNMCESEFFEKALTNIYTKKIFNFHNLYNIVTYSPDQLAINILKDISILNLNELKTILNNKKIINSNMNDINNLIVYEPCCPIYEDFFYPSLDIDKSKLDGNIYSRMFKRYNNKKVGYKLTIEGLDTKKIPDIIHCFDMDNTFVRAVIRGSKSSYKVYNWNEQTLIEELIGLNGSSEPIIKNLYYSTLDPKLQKFILKLAILDKYGGMLIDGNTYILDFIPYAITKCEFFMFFEDEYFCGNKLNKRIFGCVPNYFYYNNYFNNINLFDNKVFYDKNVVVFPSYYVNANKDGLPHCLVDKLFAIPLSKNDDIYVLNLYDQPINPITQTEIGGVNQVIEKLLIL